MKTLLLIAPLLAGLNHGTTRVVPGIMLLIALLTLPGKAGHSVMGASYVPLLAMNALLVAFVEAKACNAVDTAYASTGAPFSDISVEYGVSLDTDVQS